MHELRIHLLIHRNRKQAMRKLPIAVVKYSGHPLDGAPVQIKERRESMTIGTIDIGPVYGLLVTGGRLKNASFWLPTKNVTIIEEPE